MTKVEFCLGTDFSILETLKVHGMNIFFKLLDKDKKEANPNGVSRSQGMKTGWLAWSPCLVCER